MPYTFIQNLVSKDKFNIKCPYSMQPEFYVVHNTANSASALNEIKYMITNNSEVSFHYAIDDINVVQGLPLDRNAWHAGDGGSGSGNRKGIAVEICYSTDDASDKFAKSEQNAIEFIAQDMIKRGWGIEKLKFHKDFSHKDCPHRTNTGDFKKRVEALLNAEETETPAPTPTDEVVGRTVHLKGYLYTNSNGGGKVNTSIKTGVITKKHASGSTPYLLGNGVGWLGINDFTISGQSVAPTPPTPPKPITVGDTVKINAGAIYMINGGNSGPKVPSAYVGKPYKVLELRTLKSNGCARLGTINSWVKVKDLAK